MKKKTQKTQKNNKTKNQKSNYQSHEKSLDQSREQLHGKKTPQKTQKNEKIKNTKKNTKSQNSKKSSILSLNIRGLIPGTRRDKLIFLSTLANESEAEVIFVTETHLSEKICDSEINLPGWELTRSDRLSRQSGGVMIYYRDQITATHFNSFSNSFVETTMIFTPKTDSSWIAIYRPPHCPAVKFLESMEKISDWIVKLEETLQKTPTIYLSGDFKLSKHENVGSL